MHVMVLVKASKNSEAGVMPSPQLVAEMGRFNEELVKAGVTTKSRSLSSNGWITTSGRRVKNSRARVSARFTTNLCSVSFMATL
jgi:hypothetical protein